MSNVTLSPKAARAVKAYTLTTCVKAFMRNVEGDGARTIGFEYGLTTGQADAAINAGREYVTFTTGNDDADACEQALAKALLARASSHLISVAEPDYAALAILLEAYKAA